MKVASLLVGFSSAFALEICIKPVQNTYPEHYLSIALTKKVERAVLESGNSIGCGKDSKELWVYVKDLNEKPVAYTAQQRVSAYSLSLSISLKTEEVEKTYSNSTVYFQESGGLGNIVRRKAIDTIMNVIYPNLINDLRQLKSNVVKEY